MKSKTLTTIYFVVLVTAFLIPAWLWKTRVDTRPAPVFQQRNEERRDALRKFQMDNVEILNNYGWADEAREIVRLPIARAMELTVREWQDPAAAHSNLVTRVEKAAEPAPELPNPYE